MHAVIERLVSLEHTKPVELVGNIRMPLDFRQIVSVISSFASK